MNAQPDSLGIIIGTPKYRQYSTIKSRIASLKNWPAEKTQTIKDVAEAGFVYTGTDDFVICFYCATEIKDWPDDVCPWEQHVLVSPKCGHVIQCRGNVYMKTILGEKLNDSDVEDTQNVIDTVSQAMKKNQEAVTAARDLYKNEDLIRTAVKALIKYDICKRFTATELVKTIEKRAENHPDSDKTTDGDSSETVGAIFETNKKLKQQMSCKICLDAIASTLTIPCGHLVTCSQCTAAHSACVICGKKIEGRIRVVMAY